MAWRCKKSILKIFKNIKNIKNNCDFWIISGNTEPVSEIMAIKQFECPCSNIADILCLWNYTKDGAKYSLQEKRLKNFLISDF